MAETNSARSLDLKRLLGLVRPHWRGLSVATVSLLFGSAISLLYPQAARIAIDDIIAEGVKTDLKLVGLGLLGLFLVQSVFVSLRYYLFTVIGDRIVTDLRMKLFSSILAQEMGFFDDRRTGELTSRLTSDTQALQSAVTTNVSMSLRYGVQAIGGVIVLFVTSFQLSLVMIVAVPAVIGIAVYYGRVLRKISRQVQDAIADSTSVAEESVGGIRTVRSFAREDHERARYDVEVERSFAHARRRATLGALFGGGISFLGYATIAVILWVGSAMVIEGELTAGELTAYILYTLFVAFALGVLSGLWTDFMKAVGAGERVFELIDRLPAMQAAPEPRERPPERGHVSFEGVTFAYPTRPEPAALNDVNFEVRPGEKVALVGPSGSGKSTVANLLARFYDPERGQVRVDEVDVRTYDPDVLRASIGMVSQEPVLFSGTIRQNVQYGALDADDARVIDALEKAHAWEFVADFPDGLDTLIGERGVRLSGGQKQRIAIARAILKDPTILVLDEATSALDVESEKLVQAALERLMKGRTTLIIAHRLSTIASADRVVVLDRGRVVEQGTHHELMGTDKLYRRLVEGQQLLGA